jgi:DNA modification methylase
MTLPEPYYQDGSCTIYHGDCRDFLHDLYTVDMDLVLTDPPYGISLQNHGRSSNSYHIENDGSQAVGQRASGRRWWRHRYLLEAVLGIDSGSEEQAAQR